MMDLDDIFALTKEMSSDIFAEEAEITKPAPVKVEKVVTNKPKVRMCTACNGTGRFGQYQRGCFKCKKHYTDEVGLGYITPEAAGRNARWEQHKKAGTSTITCETHEKKQGNNSYGFVEC